MKARHAGHRQVAPGDFDQHAPRRAVAGLGDAALAPFGARGVLARHEAHEGMSLRVDSKRTKSCNSATRRQHRDGLHAAPPARYLDHHLLGVWPDGSAHGQGLRQSSSQLDAQYGRPRLAYDSPTARRLRARRLLPRRISVSLVGPWRRRVRGRQAGAHRFQAPEPHQRRRSRSRCRLRSWKVHCWPKL